MLLSIHMQPQFYAKNQSEWRAWLKTNHASKMEVWLVFMKKHTGRPCPTYNEAVEEALCWGWIDGIKRRIDDERYAFRFTPRKPASNWSPSNVKRVEKLLKEGGRMQPAGLKLVEAAKKRGAWDVPHQPPSFDIPPEFKDALAKDKQASDFFATLPPSQQKQYIGWIASAKRDDTRQTRLLKAMQMLRDKQRLGMV